MVGRAALTHDAPCEGAVILDAVQAFWARLLWCQSQRRRNSLRAHEGSVDTPSPVQVVYIGGYGRSGSSLLDALLGSRPGVVSGGELCQLFAWCAQGRPCSCGRPLGECPFWGPVVRDVEAATGLSAAALDRITVEAEMHGRQPLRWAEVWGTVFIALARRHGVVRLVDSSKTAGGRRRVLLYGSLGEAELVMMIHLHRSLGGVVHSRRRGGNLQIERGERKTRPARAALLAIAGWLWANWAASRQRRGAGCYWTVSYDRLVWDPSTVVTELIERLHWGRAAESNGLEEPHIIAGNRMLRSGWDGRVRKDESWKRDLPVQWRIVAQGTERLATVLRVAPTVRTREPSGMPVNAGSR